jgi:hypothetical protein
MNCYDMKRINDSIDNGFTEQKEDFMHILAAISS